MKFLSRKRDANDPRTLQDVIDNHLDYMSMLDNDSEKFVDALKHLEQLTKVKNDNNRSSRSIPPEAYMGAAVTVLTTLLVINSEHVGVITSKAFSFIPKPKL